MKLHFIDFLVISSTSNINGELESAISTIDDEWQKSRSMISARVALYRQTTAFNFDFFFSHDTRKFHTFRIDRLLRFTFIEDEWNSCGLDWSKFYKCLKRGKYFNTLALKICLWYVYAYYVRWHPPTCSITIFLFEYKSVLPFKLQFWRGRVVPCTNPNFNFVFYQ